MVRFGRAARWHAEIAKQDLTRRSVAAWPEDDLEPIGHVTFTLPMPPRRLTLQLTGGYFFSTGSGHLASGTAQLLASLGRYEEAKDDLDELQEGELHKEGMLLRCMVHERLEGATDNALACYEEVENAYASEVSDHPDANHILAARLAESPEAEALLREWQASDDPVEDPIVGELLEMEREALIRKLLP